MEIERDKIDEPLKRMAMHTPFPMILIDHFWGQYVQRPYGLQAPPAVAEARFKEYGDQAAAEEEERFKEFLHH